MPALLDLPKAASKQEEFVEKQMEHARKRIRALDWFATGLMLLIGALAFVFTALVVDHYVATPRGAGWAALGLFLVGVAGYLYLAMFRPSRRQINPFYAARQVEQTIPDAKNSVVNYVDLKDDEHVPGSVKTAIGARAAKDLKQVDLNQVFQKRQIIWLVSAAGMLFVAAVVAAFLPPTRTTLSLLVPKAGDTTVVQGDDCRIEVEIRGRIPNKTEPDAPRVRLWYNPDDPDTYEDRTLELLEGQRYQFGLAIPAKQVRNGFHYKVLAGDAAVGPFQVKLHIIPQFTGWTVDYEYPDYLQREPGKTNDPNLVGYYGTNVTLTALTNRPVKSGSIVMEANGQVETIAGQLVADNPEAIRFKFPMLRTGQYRIRFVTTEGDANRDPQRYRMALVDPKPAFINYAVTYDYPKYLRADPVTVNVRQPHLEALRGTKVTLVAHANRPVKDAKLEFPKQEKDPERVIAGDIDPNKPMQAKFALPPLMADGAYRVYFTPKSDEGGSVPEVFNIRVLTDEKPRVIITRPKPQPQQIDLPANNVLVVEGQADDDIGIDKMTLRMEIVEDNKANVVLESKPYRDGRSFRRDADNSYPTQVDYRDFVELEKLKISGGAAFRPQVGTVIEYWLEATDSCDVPPGPNRGYSQKQRVKITAPLTPERQKQQPPDQQRQNIQADQQQHEQKQDQRNANEKRERPQPRPKGDQQPKQAGGGTESDPMPQDGNPMQNGNPMPQGGKGGDMQPMTNDQPSTDDEKFQQDKKMFDQVANNAKPKNGMGEPTTDNMNVPKTDNANIPKKDETNVPKKDENNVPKKDQTDVPKKDQTNVPKKDQTNVPKKMGDMGADTPPNQNQQPKPEDFKDLADKLQSKDPDEREHARQQLKQMMDQAKKDPSKQDEQQKKIDEHRNKLSQEKKQEFDQAMQEMQKEMDNLQREERQERAKNAAEKLKSDDDKTRQEGQKELENLQREERVQKAADKAMSNDKQTREEGQKELEKELQNQNTRDDVERQLQHLANNMHDPNKKQKLDDAQNLARENRKKQEQRADMPPMPKKEEEDVDRLVKKFKNGTPQEKKAAEDELQKKLQDKNHRDQVQKQLDNIKKNITNEQERKNFDESMQKIKDNIAKDNAPKQPAPTSDDIKKFADQLTSDNRQEREQAAKQLEEAMKQADKDPQSREKAQKQLDDIRNSITDDKKKEQFDKSMEKIGQAVENQRREQEAKAQQQRKQDAEQLAKDLNSDDKDKQQAAQQKLEKMMQDPKNKEAVKNELEDIKKKNPAAKDNIDKAMKKAEQNLAKKGGDGTGQPKKDDIQQLAQDLNSDDKDKQQAAQQKLEKMMQDPKNKEAVKNELEDIKKKNPAAKDNIDKAMKKAEQNLAKKGGDGTGQPKKDDIQQLAQDLNSDDKDKQQAAQQKLEKMMQDPKNKEAVKNELADIKKKNPAAKDNIDKAMKKAEQNLAKKGGDGSGQPKKDDIQQLAQDLNSDDKDKQQAAQQKLEDMLKDPKQRQAVKDELDKMKANADQATKDKIDKAMKMAEDKLVKKGPKTGDSPKLDPKDVDKLVKQLRDKNPKDLKEMEKKIEEIMKDPAKRAALEKMLDDFTKDPKKMEAAKKAVDDMMKKQVETMARQFQNGTPEERQQAQNKLEEMLKDPRNREFLDKQLEKLKKDTKDDKASKDLEKKLKELEDKIAKKNGEAKKGVLDLTTKHDGTKSGSVTNEEAGPGSLPDLKNKVKSGELTLEKFKNPVTNEDLRKQLGWTREQMAAFEKKYERHLAELKEKVSAVEKGELPKPRVVGGSSSLDKRQPERISLDPKNGGATNAGGRSTAPPGLADPYRKFTDEVSGNARPPMK